MEILWTIIEYLGESVLSSLFNLIIDDITGDSHYDFDSPKDQELLELVDSQLAFVDAPSDPAEWDNIVSDLIEKCSNFLLNRDDPSYDVESDGLITTDSELIVAALVKDVHAGAEASRNTSEILSLTFSWINPFAMMFAFFSIYSFFKKRFKEWTKLC